MLNEFSKKEAPIQGLAGMGGGVPSRLLTLASGGVTYVDDVFSTFLYDGNSTNNRDIVNGIDLAGEGGLVWIKRRSGIDNHILYDTERGGSKFLESDTSDTPDSNDGLSFNSNGFRIALNSQAYTNPNGSTFCSWTFRKCPGFFDVVTYTGNGVAGRTVAHNLGSVPGCIFIRRLDISKDWIVYHRGLDSTAPEDYYIVLNDTPARVDNSIAFNDTAPTDTEFTLGTYSAVNADGGSYVAYLFAHNDGSFGEDSDEAVIKCGSYTGSTSAVTVNLGFEPQYVLVKNTSTAGNFSNWAIFDNMRGITTGADIILAANTSDPEGDTYLYSGSDLMNLSPTGFVADPPGNQSTVINSNGDNFIYIAIRRPHKPPEAATEVFAIDTKTTKSANTPSYTTNFPVDFALRRNDITSVNSSSIFSRLTATERLLTDSTAAATTAASFDNHFMFNNGYGDFTSGDSNDIGFFFKRAPGFFDVVAYDGSASAQNINHNLGVAPELIITKRRDTSSSLGWIVSSYHWFASTRWDRNGRLNQDNGLGGGGIYEPASSHSATQYPVNQDSDVNTSGGTYLSLLFASLDGISKVGTYTGTGSDVNVDCGFTNGTRLLLIKRADDIGNWFLWNSSRGIVSGNDPYIILNGTFAETTTHDYIDPLNAGFTVTSSAPATLNANGGTYLFLAIA